MCVCACVHVRMYIYIYFVEIYIKTYAKTCIYRGFRVYKVFYALLTIQQNQGFRVNKLSTTVKIMRILNSSNRFHVHS